MRFLNLCLAILLTGCASKPVLYPNNKYKQVGQEQAEKDVENCTVEAKKFLQSAQGKKIVKSVGAGAVLGGAIGAVAGLFTGNVVGGVTRGAAIGGVGGGASAALSPDEIKQRYVNQCLAEKNYQVIGWD